MNIAERRTPVLHCNRTNSIEHSPSGEANSHSASQEISRLSFEPEGSLPCSQERATGAYPDRDEYSPHLPTLFP
jgi:hypothetical protein